LLFHASTCQDQEHWSVEESNQPVALATSLDSDFPELLSTNKLLQILFRHSVEPLNKTENPGYFLCMLIGQTVEEFLDWT
jgi:hypothetical protein